MNSKSRKELIEWIKMLVLVVIVAIIISKALIVNTRVPTASMESTIMVGDRLIANRLAYLRSEPERKDIITFISKEDGGKMYVKRLIGLPGDTIDIDQGIVFVNGEELTEPYIENGDKRSFGTYSVPENHYFFLGDNRASSFDSRLWEDPYIEEDDIVGRVMFRYAPSIDIVK